MSVGQADRLVRPLIPPGSDASARTHRLTAAAEAALARVAASEDTFASVGETLMWLIALEDLIVSVDAQYWAKRGADADGTGLPGIRYARNAVVHGKTVTATVDVSGGAMLGAAVLGAFALGEGPSSRWRTRTSIAFTPDASSHVPAQEQSYDGEIAGQDVSAPLARAFAFLRCAAVT